MSPPCCTNLYKSTELGASSDIESSCSDVSQKTKILTKIWNSEITDSTCNKFRNFSNQANLI
jgi:hypothetical protein